jgi:Protein of unknown function (DUF3108)
MKNKIASFALAGVVLAAPVLSAAPLTSSGVEKLSYSWKMKGGLTFLAKLAFPSSGHGTMETHEGGTVHSQLTLVTPDQQGFYLFESSMIPSGTQTLSSRNAYALGSSRRDERVSYDTANDVAHVQRITSKGSEQKTKALASDAPQDVLTSIYYLRTHADQIRTPKRADVFSGAKSYGVLYVPQPETTIGVGKADTPTRLRPFTIKPIGDDRGEVRVWLTEDAQHVPVKMEIDQKLGATLKLYLE